MVKSFKEYFDGVSYVGGVALGNPSDNVTPIASLGDVPPKDMSGKDSRGVGLHDADKNPNDKDSKEIQKKNKDKKISIKEDGMEGPGMGTYEPTSSMNTPSSIKKTKKELFLLPRTVGPKGYGLAHPLHPNNKKSFIDKLKNMFSKTKKEDLYSDDNPKDTVKGTGYGDVATARKTLNIIKSVDKQRQMQIVNTLYNRAKHHANQTADMRAAMSIFKSWIDSKKIKESILYKHMIDKKIIKD